MCEVVSLAKPKSVSLSRALGLFVEYSKFSGCEGRIQESVSMTFVNECNHLSVIVINVAVHTLTSRWAMLIAWRNCIASPMLFMMSDASKIRKKRVF